MTLAEIVRWYETVSKIQQLRNEAIRDSRNG